MEEIRSGKELCDEFFESLVGVDNVEVEVGNLLRQLYSLERREVTKNNSSYQRAK